MDFRTLLLKCYIRLADHCGTCQIGRPYALLDHLSATMPCCCNRKMPIHVARQIPQAREDLDT